TFETLRRTFLKVATRIEELKSRVRIALPTAYPYRSAFIATIGRIAAPGP
ncbi:MAG: IS1380 family transposase, partial [Alphaproteobacteria bacterium]|nr:IS1380 family transposase [Alphaproteobacteria bacterium]